jgi:hypothetical protein
MEARDIVSSVCTLAVKLECLLCGAEGGGRYCRMPENDELRAMTRPEEYSIRRESGRWPSYYDFALWPWSLLCGLRLKHLVVLCDIEQQ